MSGGPAALDVARAPGACYGPRMIATELPAAVVAALEAPGRGERMTIQAVGIPFSALAWGAAEGRPLLLIHGVTSSAASWWRLGPALAATGRRVVAMDLPGHGLTGHWTGHHRFRDNAVDVAAFIGAAGMDRADLQVVGHSWGAMTAAALPAGSDLRPKSLILLDPPGVTLAFISAEENVASDRMYRDLEEAVAGLRAENPTWVDGDIEVRAEALLQLDVAAARSVVLDNGDWDAGLADLEDPAAADIDIWVVRGDPAAGGYLPDALIPRFERRTGAGHVLTIAGGPHTPQRTHPVETTAALLHALDSLRRPCA